jgi:glycosyltransferase involved in cell wall biosynthesis
MSPSWANINMEKTMKVLFLAGWYPNKDNPVSGIFIKRHAEAVSEYCEVVVLYIHQDSSGKSATVEYTIEDGIKTIRVYPKFSQFRNRILRHVVNCQNFYICSYLGLKVVQKEFGRPDITHVNVILPMGILAVLLKIFKGIPFILTEHTGPFNVYLSSKFQQISSKIILRNAKMVLPVSIFLKKQMELFYSGTNYQIIPNVIDCSIFFPASIKEKYPKKRMLHVSLIDDASKNISFLIRTVKKISEKRLDFEFHIIGDGIDRKKLQVLSNDLGLDKETIFFHGLLNRQDLADFYRHCNFFILVSHAETFAVVCAEALASGIPVITTKCGGPEEYIDENVGIVIEPGNQEELISAINFMLDNSYKYDPKVLHEYIKTKFGYDVIGKQIYQLYCSCLKMS